MDLLKDALVMILASIIAWICFHRGNMMNGRATFVPKIGIAGMMVSSGATVIAPLLRWDYQWILLSFLVSMAALMIDSQKEWAKGMPERYLKDKVGGRR